ncbi:MULTISPECIES: hypothetical protein [unclassified Microcoleus]|uniref:hypothetical protein n=1 Tax=unclassified Microcoleus TaxID=2642155 RepID=UPI002FD5D5F4
MKTPPNLKKYTDEVNSLQDLPAATVELPPLAAIAIISHIQFASRHPDIAGDTFTKIAIDTAKQLQNLFNPDSETYKVLELGWNPDADILVPQGTCDEDLDPEVLATIKDFVKCLKSEGFEVVTDM